MALTTLTAKKSAPDAQSLAAVRGLCQTDLFAFATTVLYAHLTPNLLTRSLHQPLAWHLQTSPYDENLYLLSRGFFKSSLITTAAVIQRILGDPATPWCQKRWRGRVCGPNTRILIASNKGENAEGFLAGIKGHLESNELLLRLFPEILVRDPQRQAREWTQGAITVSRSRRDLRESTVQTIGVTGELVSRHYDHGVFDDCVGRENSTTKDEREKVWDFLNKARPLFDPGATKDFVGTHWHYDDAYARLKALKQAGTLRLGVYEMPCWGPTHARQPDDPEVRAGIAGDVPGHGWVRVHFPERFCLDKPDPLDDTDQRLELLPERRRAPANFNAQYLLDPVSADDAHFLREDLILEDAPPPLEDLWIAMSIDPAISLKAHADYSAIAIGGFDRRSDLWLLELWQGRRDDYALVQQIFTLYDRFAHAGVKVVGFESVGFSRAYRHLITTEGERRGQYLPIIGLPRDTRNTKQVRIGGLQGQWKARQIHALRSCTALGEFLEQAEKFRMDKESAHDDLLDAVVDLYELRGRPSQPADPFLSDEGAQRARWEQRLRAEKPELDQLSLRVAWTHHQARQQDVDAAERAALAGIGDTWWG